MTSTLGTPSTLLSNAKYNAAGQLTSDSLGDGEIEAFSYDNRLRPTSLSATFNAVPTYSYSISQYAPNSDILASTDLVNENWNYSYDEFNRLTCSNIAINGTCASTSSGIPTYKYTYDRFGNRWNQAGPISFNATFTGNNPGNPQNNNRLDGYSYDASGNLLNDKTSAYTYDAENRVTQVVNGSGTATYSYDANGLRVHRTGYTATNCAPDHIMDYVYDLSGRWILQVNSGGVACGDEVYAAGRHLGSNRGGIIFSHADWLGTERVRINSAYINNRSYDEHCSNLPFGDGLYCTPAGGDPGPYTSPLHFTGKERDAESGLDNFGARYDSSSLGRWISPDAINLTDARVQNPANTLNKYVYGGNNPLKYIDLDGRDITLFYYPPAFGNAGHFSLVVADPNTGRGAVLNFGPEKTGDWLQDNSAKVNEVLLGNEPGDTDYGRHIQSADELREVAAALTIQTNPEEDQKAVDAIKRFNSGQPLDWNVLGPNCTTVCRDLVNKALGTKDHSTIQPSSLWKILFPKYANDHWLGIYYAYGHAIPEFPGHDYGSPRYGMDPFDFLYLSMNRGCKTTWGPGFVKVNCP
jgi:RHS repeat-associated protein